jgi:Undecaprenyl-phosphate glucose phosphotransferase
MKVQNLSFSGFGDLISLTAVFFITTNKLEIHQLFPTWMIFLIYSGLLSTWVTIAYSRNLYLFLEEEIQTKARMRKYLESYFILAGILGIAFLFISFSTELKKLMIFFLLGFPVTAVIINALVFRISSGIVQSKIKNSKTLVAGTAQQAKKLSQLLNFSDSYKFKIKGMVNCFDSVGNEDHGFVTSLENLSDYVIENTIDEIIVALPLDKLKEINKIREICDYEGIRFKYAMNLESLFGDKCRAYQMGEFQIINVRHIPLDNLSSSTAKDMFDVLFSGVALVFLVPFMAIVGVLIKLESPGPIFYCPIRIGKNGQPFKLYKFRSMHKNDPSISGVNSTTKNDPRITKVGKFIRKYSIDELPQFINVLKGEMSVVGPRPHRVYLNNLMRSKSKDYMIRHYYKPGLTGWAQVNGWRGPLETDEQRKERIKHDLWYLKNWSFWLDIRIIWMTIFGKKTHKSAF